MLTQFNGMLTAERTLTEFLRGVICTNSTKTWWEVSNVEIYLEDIESGKRTVTQREYYLPNHRIIQKDFDDLFIYIQMAQMWKEINLQRFIQSVRVDVHQSEVDKYYLTRLSLFHCGTPINHEEDLLIYILLGQQLILTAAGIGLVVDKKYISSATECGGKPIPVNDVVFNEPRDDYGEDITNILHRHHIRQKHFVGWETFMENVQLDEPMDRAKTMRHILNVQLGCLILIVELHTQHFIKIPIAILRNAVDILLTVPRVPKIGTFSAICSGKESKNLIGYIEKLTELYDTLTVTVKNVK